MHLIQSKIYSSLDLNDGFHYKFNFRNEYDGLNTYSWRNLFKRLDS